jgi:hypothetical protein
MDAILALYMTEIGYRPEQTAEAGAEK